MVWQHRINDLHNPATGLAVSSSAWVTQIWRSFEGFTWTQYEPEILIDKGQDHPSDGGGETVARFLRLGNWAFWEFYIIGGPNADEGGSTTGGWLISLPDEWDGLVRGIFGLGHSYDSEGYDYAFHPRIDTELDNKAHDDYAPNGNRVGFVRFDTGNHSGNNNPPALMPVHGSWGVGENAGSMLAFVILDDD